MSRRRASKARGTVYAAHLLRRKCRVRCLNRHGQARLNMPISNAVEGQVNTSWRDPAGCVVIPSVHGSRLVSLLPSVLARLRARPMPA